MESHVAFCYDKITCHELLLLLLFCQKKGFGAIYHDVHVFKPQLYEIC